MGKTVKEALGKFSKGIPIAGKTIHVNKNSKDEFTFSKNTRYYQKNDPLLLETKFRTAGSIDGVILASTNYINEALDHHRKDNIKAFTRGDVFLRIGNQDYHAKVLIGQTGGNNLVFHDIVDFSKTTLLLKKKRKASPAAMQEQEATEYDTLSIQSIPQTPEKVNTISEKILTVRKLFSLSRCLDNLCRILYNIPRNLLRFPKEHLHGGGCPFHHTAKFSP